MSTINDIVRLEDSITVSVNPPTPGVSRLAGCVAHICDACGDVLGIQKPGEPVPVMRDCHLEPTAYYAPSVRVRMIKAEVPGTNGSFTMKPEAVSGERLDHFVKRNEAAE
jgi:hypothetical protein